MKEGIKKNLQDDYARLKWACRRGMLELDVLLGNFLTEAYPSLPDEEKALFIALLNQSDPALFAWLMGHDVPQDKDTAHIVERIRLHAKSRF